MLLVFQSQALVCRILIAHVSRVSKVGFDSYLSPEISVEELWCFMLDLKACREDP